MRIAKDRHRELGVSPDYPLDLPNIRRQMYIFDLDFGFVPYYFEMRKSIVGNIRQYDVFEQNKIIYEAIGWNRFLKQIGKAFPAVLSPYNY